MNYQRVICRVHIFALALLTPIRRIVYKLVLGKHQQKRHLQVEVGAQFALEARSSDGRLVAVVAGDAMVHGHGAGGLSVLQQRVVHRVRARLGLTVSAQIEVVANGALVASTDNGERVADIAPREKKNQFGNKKEK